MSSAPSSIRTTIRALRDSRGISSLVRFPFLQLRRFGIPIGKCIYRHLPVEGIVRVDCGDGASFLIDSRGHAIENGLFWEGIRGHEPETMMPWMRLAHASKVVLDVGANVGVYALVAGCVAPSASVYAFEPLTRVCQLLRRNIELNRFDQVVAVEAAVGESNEQGVLFDPGGDQPASASLRCDFLGYASESRPVRVLTVDSFVDENGLSTVDLVKIDIEGAEESALRGMVTTIHRFQPAIVLEVLQPRPELTEIACQLRKLGYRIFELTNGGLNEHDNLQRWASRNALLVPPRFGWIIDQLIVSPRSNQLLRNSAQS